MSRVARRGAGGFCLTGVGTRTLIVSAVAVSAVLWLIILAVL